MSESKPRHRRIEGELQRSLSEIVSREEVLEGLTRASGFLRGEVGRRLGLRHAPKLEFEFDDSFEKAAKLNELIDRAPK
jgi:ribosome-binding factor A